MIKIKHLHFEQNGVDFRETDQYLSDLDDSGTVWKPLQRRTKWGNFHQNPINIDEFTDMYTKAGFINIQTQDNNRTPGNDIHEMGGVRMGKDPKTSILNAWNQMHHCKNVFVTDGACMTSTSTQNPSLTFMAISARAANYAIEQLKKGEI